MLLLVLNIPLIGIWVNVLRIPYRMLYPAILCLICIGVYSLSLNVFDLLAVFLFGVPGFGMRLAGYEPAPLLMGFILGPFMEQYVRRAMLLAQGDVGVFVRRPISASVLLLTVALVLRAAAQQARRRRSS